MKSAVYRTKVDTREKLLNLITDVIASIKKSKALRLATCHVLTRAANCKLVDCGIFENVLFWVNCTNFKFFKFYSHQLMHFLIQPCISLLSYIKIT